MTGKNDRPRIVPAMTVLDVVSKHRRTERIFKAYDDRAGVCICCEALFEPLGRVAEKYGLNLDRLIEDLTAAAAQE